MATKLKIEKRGDEIIPLEMHFYGFRQEDFYGNFP
jgi:hypothetical protein